MLRGASLLPLRPHTSRPNERSRSVRQEARCLGPEHLAPSLDAVKKKIAAVREALEKHRQAKLRAEMDFCQAARSDDAAQLRNLLAMGGGVNSASSRDRLSALHGHKEVATLLDTHGA